MEYCFCHVFGRKGCEHGRPITVVTREEKARRRRAEEQRRLQDAAVGSTDQRSLAPCFAARSDYAG